MKLSKKIVVSLLVVTLVIGSIPMGIMGATKNVTNSVPSKSKLIKLVNQFSTPIAVTETYIMKAGETFKYDFSKKVERRNILRFINCKKSKINKYSKRMFGKKTNKVKTYPGDWGDAKAVTQITSIYQMNDKEFYVKGMVYIASSYESKTHHCGTFRLYVKKNKKAKYKYYATKLSITTCKQAKYTKTKINGFSGASKYKNIKGTMTYNKINVSKVTGAKKINAALNADCNNFIKSNNAQRFYAYVAEDNAKGIKDKYYYTADSKMKYNMNNIISIRVRTLWYVGGVVNEEQYGFNFNAVTGKKIKIKNVVNGSTKKIKKKMVAKIKKTKGLKKYKKKAIKYINNANLDYLDFYMKNDKVIICFKPYTFGKSQKVFKTFYIQSKYF